jgi:hypothetical protein
MSSSSSRSGRTGDRTGGGSKTSRTARGAGEPRSRSRRRCLAAGPLSSVGRKRAAPPRCRGSRGLRRRTWQSQLLRSQACGSCRRRFGTIRCCMQRGRASSPTSPAAAMTALARTALAGAAGQGPRRGQRQRAPGAPQVLRLRCRGCHCCRARATQRSRCSRRTRGSNSCMMRSRWQMRSSSSSSSSRSSSSAGRAALTARGVSRRRTSSG